MSNTARPLGFVEIARSEFVRCDAIIAFGSVPPGAHTNPAWRAPGMTPPDASARSFVIVRFGAESHRIYSTLRLGELSERIRGAQDALGDAAWSQANTAEEA